MHTKSVQAAANFIVCICPLMSGMLLIFDQDTEYSSIYSTLSNLRDEKINLMERVNDTQDINTQDRLKQQLDALDSQIEEQLDHRRKR